MSIGLHRIAVITGLHVDINAGQNVSKLVYSNRDLDLRVVGCSLAAKLLLTRFSLNEISGSVEHVEDIINRNLGFLVLTREVPLVL